MKKILAGLIVAGVAGTLFAADVNKKWVGSVAAYGAAPSVTIASETATAFCFTMIAASGRGGPFDFKIQDGTETDFMVWGATAQVIVTFPYEEALCTSFGSSVTFNNSAVNGSINYVGYKKKW